MLVVCIAAMLVLSGATRVVFASPGQTPNAADTTKPETPATPAPAADTQPPPRLAGPQPQQDTFTAADEAPGSRNVTVSFTDNFIGSRLPFDVPFNVTGNVEPGVRRLDLTVYRVGSNVNLASLINYLQSTVDCVGKQAPGEPVSRSTVVPGGGRFSLFVNALDPQYFYAFCFVGVSPVPTSEFETDVRRLIATSLPVLSREADLKTATLRVVHRAMSERIAQIGAGRKVPAKAPADNIFARPEPTSDFGDVATALVEAYGNLPGQLDNYTQAMRQFVTDLAAARAHAATRALLTNEIVTSFPPAARRLPTIESAITGNGQFDRTQYVFDTAVNLLDGAISSAPDGSAQKQNLDTLKTDLETLADAAKTYLDFYQDLRDASARFIGFVKLEASEVTVTLGSSVLGADLARSAYVSMDAGIAYPWRLENMVFYAGTNIYFRPINKAAPLRYKGTFLHRFALTVGVTTTVHDESRRAEDLRPTANNNDTSNSLLLGGGLRVTPSLRVGAGVLVFKETDTNPLVNQSSVAVTPYVAFTADVNVAQIFRSLF